MRRLLPRVRIMHPIFVRVVKHGAGVVIQEAFRESTLGDDDVMGVKLDMEILDLLDALGLHDRHAVEEIVSLNQDAIDIHGVVGRDPQVAPGDMILKCAGADTDRQYILAPHDEAAAVAALPDPFDRPRHARHGDDPVAGPQQPAAAGQLRCLRASTWSREPCRLSTIRSARDCHPCLRYNLSPMSPGRTPIDVAGVEGLEPPTPGFGDRCSSH